MTERIKSFLVTFAIPLLAFAAALGAAEFRIQSKESAAEHALDIQKLESRQKAAYDLLLDMRCETKPTDRRCN